MNLLEKRSRKIGKKGQVTIFIIVGIVIVFAAFFVGFLQNENFRQKVESSLFGKFVVPEQAQGVVSYLDNCLYNIADDGIKLLGVQGGYIEIPETFNSRQYLQSDTLIKMPYWIYGSKIVVPSLRQMETELENYINNRANLECNFEEFSDYQFKNKQIDVNVNIVDDGVLIKLNSEINFNVKENAYTLSDYVLVNVPAALKELYEMSIDLVNRELKRATNGNAPLEAATMELIASYSKDEDSDLIDLPPTSKFDYSCNPKTWLIEDVKKDVKEILSDNMRFLRVDGVDNADYGENYVNLVIDRVFSGNHRDVKVDFNYNEEWPIFFDVQPRKGATLKPDSLKLGLPFMPLFCFTTYNFRYSLQYPLMINLEKDGFLFRFPVEVIIQNNYAARNIDGEILDVNFEDTATRFCDQGQRLSDNFNIVTLNEITGQPLDDVQILYTCGVNSCVVGNTKIQNGEAILNERLPLCYNGEIRLSKEGYGDYKEELSTLDSANQQILGVMKPLIEKDVELRVIELKDGIASERKLKSNEIASVQFNVFDENSLIDETAIVFEGDNLEKVDLLPDQEYNILINLIVNGKITIPAGKYNGQEIPAQDVDNLLLGGADFNVYIDQGSLIESNKIIIYTLSNGIPTNYEDYVENFDVKTLSDLNRDKLELKFE